MLASLLSWNLTPTALSTLPNPPGRVFKGQYPCWRERRKPYWEIGDDPEEEEVTMTVAMEDY